MIALSLPCAIWPAALLAAALLSTGALSSQWDELDDLGLVAVPDHSLLASRQTLPKGQCSATQPCADASCCDGTTGFCGLDPAHCAAGTCVSNCNATAECGIGASPQGKTCPLNVCCGQFGYCGVTSDFCGTGCQSNCIQPGPTNLGDGDVQQLVIGYLESWAINPVNADYLPTGSVPTGGCSLRTLDWIPVDSLTHLNVAFGYIKPDEGFYDIAPIDGADLGVFQQITNLKQQAPGLKIWISLGGWTYSDNGTVTQAIWGDITSSSGNITKFVNLLIAFMRQWGFDGVDLDWEYPGAPDRGGTTKDTPDYVSLLATIRAAFDAEVTETGGTFGLSFTAPTSYWYLRWFDIGNMTQYADWVNLMTYDLHGDWDSPTDTIGSNVFAHTNLTEIEYALNLLWRNNVPADKVNLGIGFYGRSYTLSDPSCTSPGCPFSAGGNAGPCTNTAGYLSFDEIMTILNSNDYQTVYDQEAGVKYFAFNQNQWVSFDDVQTLEQKVQFANKQGLRGLFIWAIDQDNATHAALNAVLYPKGLGKFNAQNGVGLGDYGNWSLQASSCYWGECGENPTCSEQGYIPDSHQIRCSDGSHRVLCCPLGSAPDPSTCHWNYGSNPPACLDAQCPSSTILIAESNWYWEQEANGNGDAFCFWKPAQYCCDIAEGTAEACGPNTGTCININTKTGQPASSQDSANACPTGREFFTYSEGTCDSSKGLYMPWCCTAGVDTSSCYWGITVIDNLLDCSKAMTCGTNEIKLGTDHLGNGSDCRYFDPPFAPTSPYQQGTWYTTERSLCCNANAVYAITNNLPVDLDNIFPSQPPKTNKNEFEIHTDSGLNPEGLLGDQNPNSNAFGWYIISGPPSEVSSMDKRDGSHWELLGCYPDMGETRHTVQAVCTDESDESNCDEIFLGEVATTVVKMPPECGPGKYAVAVSMEPAMADQSTLPARLVKRLEKRGIERPRVYAFTFDYDYGPIVRRQDSNKLIRIDYSDDPGYWANVILAPPGKNAKRREPKEMGPEDLEEHIAWVEKRSMDRRALQDEVDRNHGGSWESFLDHRWSVERRATPHDELHLLHERWFSATLADWLYEQRHIDITYQLIRHHVNDIYTWNLFDYTKICSLGGAKTTQYLKIWADLTVNVDTSASITLIGNFGDLGSWDESHVLFRNSGSVKATLNFDAFASMQFSTGRVELFGLQNFGATFSVPGIVTIGPNLRVFGEIDGVASFHANAQVSMQLAEWDYTQQYPNPNNDVASGLSQDGQGAPLADVAGSDDSGSSTPQWHGDVAVQGSLTVHLTPVAQLGVVFNILSETLPNTVLELGLDTYGTIFASAEATGNNNEGQVQACYGTRIGYELYARVTAPSLFGYPLDSYWPLNSNNLSLIDEANACVAYTPYNNTS